MKEYVVKGLLFGLAVGLLIGFGGGYAYKNYYAAGGGGTGENPGQWFKNIIVGSVLTAANSKFDETKLVPKNSQPFTCPDSFTNGPYAGDKGPFYKKQSSAFALDYANIKKNDPTKDRVRINNPDAGEKRVMGYDKYYIVGPVDTATTFFYAEHDKTVERVRIEPPFMYREKVGKFGWGGDKYYRDLDVIGELEDGETLAPSEVPEEREVICSQ